MAVVITNSRRSRPWVRKLHIAKEELKRQQRDWKRNRSLLLGLPPTGTADWASVNLAWAAFETMVGICYQQNPEFIVRETNAAGANAAKLLTMATFEDFEAMRTRYHIRLAIMDVFWAGCGYIVEKLLGDITTDTYQWIEDGKPESFEYPSLKNRRTVTQRVHPNSLLKDPYGTMGDLSDAQWIAFEFYPTVAELRSSKEFNVSDALLKALPKLKIAPALDSPFGQTTHPSVIENSGDDRDEYAKVRIYECWDRINKRKLYIPALSDEIIGEVDWPVPCYYNGLLRYPVVPLFFNEHPDSNFPIPEISTAAPQIEQFQILFRTTVRDAVTRWRKYIVQGDLIQKGHIGRITTGPANAVISIDAKKVGDSSKLDLSRVIMPIPDTPVKQDVLGVMQVVKGLVHEIFGAGDFASAGFRSTRSATEAAALSDFLKVRMTNRTENIDACFKDLGTNHCLILQQTLDDKRVLELTDDQGVKQFQSFDKEQIQGNFKFRVLAGSSQTRNSEVARQEALSFYQLTMPQVAQSGGDIRPLIDWIAPHYRMPQHIVDALFAGHKQALQQLALIMAAVHMGARVPGAQLIEAISLAVNTGLSQSDMAAILKQAQSAQKEGPPTQGGGLPGANGAPGTSGAPGPPS